MLGAFATPSGIPFCYLNLRTGRGHEVVSSTAEVTLKAMDLVKSMDMTKSMDRVKSMDKVKSM